MVITTTFDKENITRHTGGRSLKETYSYENISSMGISGGFLSISFTSGLTMYLDADGFKDSSLEEAKDFLSMKTGKQIK